MSKPSIPKGTRDFGPLEMSRRNYIFGTIRSVFQTYGFEQIETPAMEALQTLTGKYGEEGDQLIFKILNNGDFLAKADQEAIAENDSKKLAFSISKKALRYDLTVPFARYVVMNQHALAFPFRRFQIQPVWRGDRPGKGRYQEFYQCDADIVGTNSLLCEVELIRIFDAVLTQLGIPGVKIHLNNRKVLAGIAEVCGVTNRLTDLTVAIDKLDKIGQEGVEKELRERNFSESEITSLQPLFVAHSDNSAAMATLQSALADSETGRQGIAELNEVLDLVELLGLRSAELKIDPTLARGLDYYTGAIFEVKVDESPVGSICGGGRYDDLTGIFGLKDLSGVGISFGADRIYDVMEAFDLFPATAGMGTQLLFTNFGGSAARYAIQLAEKLRSDGVACEVYPEDAKIKKQMKYANDKRVAFVAMAGDDEIAKGVVSVKNMTSGAQEQLKPEEIKAFIADQLSR